jgi:hypothetical protein
MKNAARSGGTWAAFGASEQQEQEQLFISAAPSEPQDLPPLERHWPLADDKLALFEIAPVHRLAGRWQGPGRIREMRGRRA